MTKTYLHTRKRRDVERERFKFLTAAQIREIRLACADAESRCLGSYAPLGAAIVIMSRKFGVSIGTIIEVRNSDRHAQPL